MLLKFELILTCIKAKKTIK